jgi:carbamoyltransferase
MEFGARALGNRSILARADSATAVRQINHAIKQRDFWMPFAPTVLAERSNEYCDKPKSHVSPYMMMTYAVRSPKRAALQAAMHPADYSTRPQELRPGDNAAYYRLLKAYESITGEAAVLNTSFNIHGEPIVRTAWDAVDVFLRSGLRHMALADLWVEKL